MAIALYSLTWPHMICILPWLSSCAPTIGSIDHKLYIVSVVEVSGALFRSLSNIHHLVGRSWSVDRWRANELP